MESTNRALPDQEVWEVRIDRTQPVDRQVNLRRIINGKVNESYRCTSLGRAAIDLVSITQGYQPGVTVRPLMPEYLDD